LFLGLVGRRFECGAYDFCLGEVLSGETEMVLNSK